MGISTSMITRKSFLVGRIAGYVYLLVFSGLLILLSSCKPPESPNCVIETPHPRSFDLVEGELFLLEVADEVDLIQYGQEISLRIINISEKTIWFPPDLNLIIMNRISEKSYSIFPVISSTLLPTDIILEGSQSPDNTFQFTFTPSIPYLPNEMNIEVFVSGYIYENGKICPGRYRALTVLTIQP
jgi:hypothetical protein